MRKQLVHTLHRTQTTVGSFSTPQKVIAVIGIAVLVLGGVMFARWANTPTMVQLYSDVDATDAAAMTDSLTAAGISYELTENGSTIMVPQADRNKARLALAKEGLPASSKSGWSIIDDAGISTSQQVMDINKQRALEGELGKVIEGIDGVNAANVSLALPKKDVFVDETTPPSASVLLTTSAGRTLTPEQVQSIIHLVVGAIPDMQSENVTLVDEKGNLLSAAGGGGAGGLLDQMQAKATTELRLGLQRILDKVVGPDNAVASVKLEVDQAKTNSTEEKFDSEPERDPFNSKRTTETYEGEGGAATGVLGPDNIQVPGGTAGGESKYTKETETRNNPVDKITIHSLSNGGRITRQNVSILLDSAAAGAVDMDTLRQTIAAAAGIDAERGDTFAVNQLPFNKDAIAAAEAAAEEARKAEQMAMWISIAKTAAIALAIIILAIVALIISRRREEEEEEEDEEFIDLSEPEIVEEEPAAIEAPPEPPRPQLPAIPMGELPQVEGLDPAYAAMRDDIRRMVDKQPDEVAELLRGWLADRRS